jgi:hypothetical protein
MRRTIIAATLLGLAFASSASAQAPNVQQLLGGLLTGNQNQDQALRDAFERGYQRGRQDEAKQQARRGQGDRAREGRGTSQRDSADERDQGGYGQDRGGYRDERGPDQPYGRPGGNYDDR